jgi:hypothetical protein
MSYQVKSSAPVIGSHADNSYRYRGAQTSGLALVTEGSSDPCPCTVIAFQRGEIHVRTDVWIKPATRIEVRLAGAELCGVVSYCTREINGYLICIATRGDGRGRRGSSRRPVDAPCALITPGDSGASWTDGRITDYSWFGLGVKSPLNPGVETVVCVKTEAMLIAGLVRHYQRCEDGIVHTGIDVTDVLHAADPNARAERFIHKMRRSVAQLVLGRPIDRFSPLCQAIPWALSGTNSGQSRKY